MREVPQKGRPSKKVYSITDKGQVELTEWLKRPAAADQVRREFLLKLYLAKDLSEKDLLVLLSARRGETEALLRFLRMQREGKDGDNLHRKWVMDYALSLCRAEMDWLKQLESQIGVV